MKNLVITKPKKKHPLILEDLKFGDYALMGQYLILVVGYDKIMVLNSYDRPVFNNNTPVEILKKGTKISFTI